MDDEDEKPGWVFALQPTGHEREAAGQLHDPRGGAGSLEDSPVGTDVAVGRDGGQVVGDGKRRSAAHLHGGGGGGYCGLGAAGRAWQGRYCECRLQGVLREETRGFSLTFPGSSLNSKNMLQTGNLGLNKASN